MKRSTDLTSIEVREGSKNYYLLTIIFCIGLLAFNSQHYFDNGVFDIKKITFHHAFYDVLLIIAIPGCIYFYYDKRIKVIIDNTGIWTKKYDAVPWGIYRILILL